MVQMWITDDPRTLWKNGMVKKCDIIIGITKDEMFFSQWSLIISHRDIAFYSEHFEDVLRNHFGNASQEVYIKARALYQPKCIPPYIKAIRPTHDMPNEN